MSFYLKTFNAQKEPQYSLVCATVLKSVISNIDLLLVEAENEASLLGQAITLNSGTMADKEVYTVEQILSDLNKSNKLTFSEYNELASFNKNYILAIALLSLQGDVYETKDFDISKALNSALTIYTRREYILKFLQRASDYEQNKLVKQVPPEIDQPNIYDYYRTVSSPSPLFMIKDGNWVQASLAAAGGSNVTNNALVNSLLNGYKFTVDTLFGNPTETKYISSLAFTAARYPYLLYKYTKHVMVYNTHMISNHVVDNNENNMQNLLDADNSQEALNEALRSYCGTGISTSKYIYDYDNNDDLSFIRDIVIPNRIYYNKRYKDRNRTILQNQLSALSSIDVTTTGRNVGKQISRVVNQIVSGVVAGLAAIFIPVVGPLLSLAILQTSYVVTETVDETDKNALWSKIQNVTNNLKDNSKNITLGLSGSSGTVSNNAKTFNSMYITKEMKSYYGNFDRGTCDVTTREHIFITNGIFSTLNRDYLHQLNNNFRNLTDQMGKLKFRFGSNLHNTITSIKDANSSTNSQKQNLGLSNIIIQAFQNILTNIKNNTDVFFVDKNISEDDLKGYSSSDIYPNSFLVSGLYARDVKNQAFMDEIFTPISFDIIAGYSYYHKYSDQLVGDMTNRDIVDFFKPCTPEGMVNLFLAFAKDIHVAFNSKDATKYPFLRRYLGSTQRIKDVDETLINIDYQTVSHNFRKIMMYNMLTDALYSENGSTAKINSIINKAWLKLSDVLCKKNIGISNSDIGISNSDIETVDYSNIDDLFYTFSEVHIRDLQAKEQDTPTTTSSVTFSMPTRTTSQSTNTPDKTYVIPDSVSDLKLEYETTKLEDEKTALSLYSDLTSGEPKSYELILDYSVKKDELTKLLENYIVLDKDLSVSILKWYDSLHTKYINTSFINKISGISGLPNEAKMGCKYIMGNAGINKYLRVHPTEDNTQLYDYTTAVVDVFTQTSGKLTPDYTDSDSSLAPDNSVLHRPSNRIYLYPRYEISEDFKFVNNIYAKLNSETNELDKAYIKCPSGIKLSYYEKLFNLPDVVYAKNSKPVFISNSTTGNYFVNYTMYVLTINSSKLKDTAKSGHQGTTSAQYADYIYGFQAFLAPEPENGLKTLYQIDSDDDPENDFRGYGGYVSRNVFTCIGKSGGYNTNVICRYPSTFNNDLNVSEKYRNSLLRARQTSFKPSIFIFTPSRTINEETYVNYIYDSNRNKTINGSISDADYRSLLHGNYLASVGSVNISGYNTLHPYAYRYGNVSSLEDEINEIKVGGKRYYDENGITPAIYRAYQGFMTMIDSVQTNCREKIYSTSQSRTYSNNYPLYISSKDNIKSITANHEDATKITTITKNSFKKIFTISGDEIKFNNGVEDISFYNTELKSLIPRISRSNTVLSIMSSSNISNISNYLKDLYKQYKELEQCPENIYSYANVSEYVRTHVKPEFQPDQASTDISMYLNALFQWYESESTLDFNTYESAIDSIIDSTKTDGEKTEETDAEKLEKEEAITKATSPLKEIIDYYIQLFEGLYVNNVTAVVNALLYTPSEDEYNSPLNLNKIRCLATATALSKLLTYIINGFLQMYLPDLSIGKSADVKTYLSDSMTAAYTKYLSRGKIQDAIKNIAEETVNDFYKRPLDNTLGLFNRTPSVDPPFTGCANKVSALLKSNNFKALVQLLNWGGYGNTNQ